MAPGSRYPKVDVHSHFVPDFYRDELVATGNEKVDGMPGIPVSTLARDDFDDDDDDDNDDDDRTRHDVAEAVLSLADPGLPLARRRTGPRRRTSP
jgi:hypothetical protein